MLYAFKRDADVLVVLADDEGVAVATLLDNKLIASPDEVEFMTMGNVVRVRHTPVGPSVMGEVGLLDEVRIATVRGPGGPRQGDVR